MYDEYFERVVLMIDYSWLNLGSLILGLIAWLIPFFGIIRHKKSKGNVSLLLLLVSVGACATALWFQISYNNYLVHIQDWTALMDTSPTLNWVAGILLIGTLTLNVVHIVLYKNVTSK